MTDEPRTGGSEIKVHRAEEVDRLAVAMFGRRLLPPEWAQAVGAPEGARWP